MNTGRKRNDIMQEFLAMFRRGQISKKQYLTQKKAMLLEEQTEKQKAHDEAQASLDSISRQLKEVETELEMIAKDENA